MSERLILDATVLATPPVRDLFLRLAHAGAHDVRWSLASVEQALIAMMVNHPERVTPQALASTRTLLREGFPGWVVDASPELASAIALDDQRHRAAVAAALATESDVIVTLDDDEEPTLGPLGLSLRSPDDHLLGIVRSAPRVVWSAATLQATALEDPPLPLSRLLTLLRDAGLPRSVDELHREYHGAPP